LMRLRSGDRFFGCGFAAPGSPVLCILNRPTN
jgi:hypothetical protein